MTRLGMTSLFVLAFAPAFAQQKTYIALGDSLAWGYQPNDLTRGPGDKGYVKLYADWLATKQGVRPRLINLGVPGETTQSFNDTSEIGALLNSNYPVFGRKSQKNTFVDKVNQETSAGRIITHVTFDIGGNDLLDLLTNQFLALPFETQRAQVDQELALLDIRLATIFSQVRQSLPSAVIVVPGYYNPYAAFPGSPSDKIARYAMPRLNQSLYGRALQYNGLFAETYSAFVGHEATLTWIGQDDIHPNSAGYVAYGLKVVAKAANPLADRSYVHVNDK
ncbi:MAG: hypothetical protein JNM34_07485 [Chthonomonadaceae bacterium]|nr:hypothetical protein [Chthonomonadaceae bacterium]